MVQAATFVPWILAQIGASWLSFLHQNSTHNQSHVEKLNTVSTSSPLYNMQLNRVQSVAQIPCFLRKIMGT